MFRTKIGLSKQQFVVNFDGCLEGSILDVTFFAFFTLSFCALCYDKYLLGRPPVKDETTQDAK